MQNLERAVVILKLADALREGGSWSGETHLQKAVYFLQCLLEVPLEFDFVLYKRGPFSFDLRDQIGSMVAHNLMDVQTRQAPYGPTLVPSEQGYNTEAALGDPSGNYEADINFVAGKLAEKSAAQLERVGTALYVTLDEQRDRTDAGRAQRINELKPHITVDAALQAVQEVDRIITDANAST